MSLALDNIYLQAFGTEPPLADANRFNIEAAPGRKNTSSLGQPYYETDLLGREFFLPVRLDGLLIPFAVVGITEKKTIVSTPMPERGGSVKEMISVDDYLFNIKGILINDADEWPEAEIIALHKLFEKNESLILRSAITDIFLNGSAEHRVVVKQISWPSVSGVENAKPFEMELESDMIFNLELEKLFVGPVNIGV
ncbi:MAG: hypothetical protein ABS68_00275 [Niastella sp. SCN 39-18]|nr:hypothetical protein [Sphingobacteriales bacterium]ODT55187.1 MAG: hypothetical protein ABS68_00275 [Niastella sp. SCN 39-18]OJW09101.1 MAG: hypothetical protein BGO53_00130 [Sphingobacteriales bacterium 39-19]